MRKRKSVKPPPLQGVVSIRDSAEFWPEQVEQIIQAVGKPAFQEATWIAEALNETTETYYASFAISQMGTPSEQAAWANALKTAAETCLQMLVRNASISERPRCADHRVQSALFHVGEPHDIEVGEVGSASIWGYAPVRDALDAIPGALWDLRKMADFAEQRWRAAKLPRTRRRMADSAILSWIADLANVYERIFRLPAPTHPKAGSKFVIFAECARAIAQTASPTEHGTDEDARARLAKLIPSRFCSYAREHKKHLQHRLKQAREQDYTPYRIKFALGPSAEGVGNQALRKI
jgi:hypothetical protein